MEDLEHGYSKNLLDNLDLEIDEQTTASINEASKWAKFISIVMFCICGLLLIFLAVGSMSIRVVDGFNTGFRQYANLLALSNRALFFGIIIMAMLIIITIYYFLFKFSKKARMAVIAENTTELNKGLSSLKIYFIIYAALGLLSISTSVFSLLKLF